MSIYEKLFDWQKSIVDQFIDRTSFGLFLDCGLGKTPLSLAFAEKHHCEKIIIVTINSKALESIYTPGSWYKWATYLPGNYNLCTKATKKFYDKDILIINYEALFKREKNFREALSLADVLKTFVTSCFGKNVALIIDESHKMKNPQSKQTKALFQIKSQLEKISSNVYTYLLTGTPFTTGYIDLYTQLKMLGSQMTKQHFVDEFCEKGHIPGLYEWQQPIIGYKNVEKLFDIIHQYAITIESKDVLDLPEQIFNYHVSKCSEAFKLFTSETLKRDDIVKELQNRNLSTLEYDRDKKYNNPFYRNIAYPDLDWLAETTGTFWLRAREISIGFNGNSQKSIWYDQCRLKQFVELLQNNEDNYVIFYNFVPELLELYQICDDLGYNIDVYCGDMKSLIFYEKYANMPLSEKLTNKKNVILANFASGSTGMNWQAYNKCIIFSLPLFKDWVQGLKRVHRTGQKETVIYHVFYQNNWLDLSMKKSLEESIQYNEDMFQSDLQKENLE